MIGESWEVADLDATAPEGGGGGAARSVVASGPLAGVGLDGLVRDHREALLGRSAPSAWGGFPLLVKLLDARENLSVQVHPSPAYAAAHAGAHLKTESWCIVEAAPGAMIYAGVRDGVDRASFAARIRSGEVADDLAAIPARAGDVLHLPSGTCHALGAGVLVAEVQTPSDTTFRVFDWGRTDRALHVEQALECIEFGGAGRVGPVRGDGGPRCVLVESPYYTLAERRLAPGEHEVEASADGPLVWMWLQGRGAVRGDADGFATPAGAGPGTTVLLPASIGRARVRVDEACVVLEAAAG